MGWFSRHTDTSAEPTDLGYAIDDRRISEILNSPLTVEQSNLIQNLNNEGKWQDHAAENH